MRHTPALGQQMRKTTFLSNCVAGAMTDGYIKGNLIRQDYLKKALAWIAD